MAGHGSEIGVVPSLLDRLASEKRAQRWLSNLEQFRHSVARDLAALLNTQAAVGQIPDRFQHVRTSVLAYGLPEFGSASFASPDACEVLRLAIERAVRLFEPRLDRVMVTLLEGKTVAGRVRFRIDALLKVEPAVEPVTFETVLHVDTAQFEVSGEVG